MSTDAVWGMTFWIRKKTQWVNNRGFISGKNRPQSCSMSDVIPVNTSSNNRRGVNCFLFGFLMVPAPQTLFFLSLYCLSLQTLLSWGDLMPHGSHRLREEPEFYDTSQTVSKGVLKSNWLITCQYQFVKKILDRSYPHVRICIPTQH